MLAITIHSKVLVISDVNGDPMKTIGLSLFILLLFLLGIVCLLFPEKIQTFANKSVNQGFTAHNDALKNFVQSSSYLINVRVVGAIALICSLFLLWVFIKNL